MDTIRIETFNSDDFQKAHQGKLGSADICTIAGLNKWETPLQLWARKTGKAPEKEETQAMFLGKRMEAVVAELYQRDNPTTHVKKCFESYVSKEKPWMIATPDYFLEQSDKTETILECKTTSHWGKDYWQSEVPDYAHCQVQWQMGIVGIHDATLACLAGGSDFLVHKVTFSKDVFEQLTELGEKFMELIRTDTPPQATANDLTDLYKKFVPEKGTTMAPTPEIDDLVHEYFETKQQIKLKEIPVVTLKNHLDNIKADIISKMAAAALCEGSKYRIKRSQTIRKAYSVDETTVNNFTVTMLGGAQDE